MAAHKISLPISAAAVVSAAVKITPAAPRRNISCVVGVQCGVQANLRHRRRLRVAAGIAVQTGLSANLKRGKRHRISLSIGAKTGMQSRFCTLANGVTVRDAVNAIMSLWGQSCGNAESPLQGEAVGYLNAAMQRLHASGKDFGFISRINRSYEVPGTGDSIPLESDVQHVEGNVVFDKPAENIVLYPGTEFETTVQLYPAERTPLRPLGGSEAVESVRQRYGGLTNASRNQPNQSGNGVHARPLAYFVRSETYAGDPRLILELAPKYLNKDGTEISNPIAALTVDLHLKPPRFSCCDVRSGIKLPVPHRYAESLLIPLARYLALAGRYRVQESTGAMVRQQASEVRKLLGDVDPRDAEVQTNRTP